MSVKIFIGNLSSDTVTEDIQPLFERYGHVEECAVLRNFGFVHMKDESEATAAINELTGTLIKGSRMRVEMSTGKSVRGGGDRGGGKMGFVRGRGGRGRGEMRGASRGGGRGDGGRDRFQPPSRGLPYAREPYPYDYYDRHYPPPPRPGERSRAPPHPEDRRYAYPEDDRRLPPPIEDRYRESRERYPPPPPSRYERAYEDRYYDRYPPAAEDPYRRDPYERPPQDYYSRYRAYDGYSDPVRRPAPEDPPAARYPPPGERPAANGYDYDVADYRKGAPSASSPSAGQPPAEPASFGSFYSSYYNRFYNKQSNGAGGAGAGGPGAPKGYGALGQSAPPGQYSSTPSNSSPSLAATKKPADQQSRFQTGPIYF